MIKRNDGFTMMELIIVIAIIGIIGALLVPAYSTITANARLTTDISTIQTVQRMADLYEMEQGKFPEGEVATELKDKGYLDTDVNLQTEGTITVKDNQVKLNTSTLDSTQYGKAYGKLKEDVKERWCDGEPKGGVA